MSMSVLIRNFVFLLSVFFLLFLESKEEKVYTFYNLRFSTSVSILSLQLLKMEKMVVPGFWNVAH